MAHMGFLGSIWGPPFFCKLPYDSQVKGVGLSKLCFASWFLTRCFREQKP